MSRNLGSRESRLKVSARIFQSFSLENFVQNIAGGFHRIHTPGFKEFLFSCQGQILWRANVYAYDRFTGRRPHALFEFRKELLPEYVDTLFKVEQFLGVFCYSDSCRDSVKTGVVEGFVVFQHAMDSMQ